MLKKNFNLSTYTSSVLSHKFMFLKSKCTVSVVLKLILFLCYLYRKHFHDSILLKIKCTKLYEVYVNISAIRRHDTKLLSAYLLQMLYFIYMLIFFFYEENFIKKSGSYFFQVLNTQF